MQPQHEPIFFLLEKVKIAKDNYRTSAKQGKANLSGIYIIIHYHLWREGIKFLDRL